MPTIVYSPAQQAQLDAANKAVADAQANLLSYTNAVNSEYNSMNSVFGNVNKNCYKNLPQSLTQQLSIGNMDGNSCCTHVWHSSAEVNACHKSVSDFNYYFNNWKSYSAQVVIAKSNLDTAQKALQNLTNTLNQDPNVASQINANAQMAQTTKSKWLFFGIAVIIIAAAAFFVGKILLTTTKSAS